MLLIKCEINLMFIWSEKYIIVSYIAADQETGFAMTDFKIYALVVTLSNQDNTKLLQQLKLGF